MTGRFGRVPAGGRTTFGLTVASLVLATVALTGCSNNTDSSAGPVTPQAGQAGQDAGRGNSGGAAGGQGSPALAPQQRAIIYTGTMVVTVADVVRAADAAGAVAVAAGGSVEADRRTLDGDHSEAVLALRVPTGVFSSTLDKLAHLGTEQSRAVSTQDVTNDLIDLDARLATQRASVNRIRALLAQATTISDIVTIESELTKREADLDSLEQRQAALSSQVALSTITITLNGAVASPTPPASHSGLLYGLRSGWSAFLVSAKAVLTVAGWLAPWLVIVGIPVWLVVYYVRRRRRSLVRPSTGSGGADQA